MNKQKISQRPVLFIAPDYRTLRLARTALFNRFGLECYGISYDQKDTEFSYQVLTDTKISKARLTEIQYYCEGFLEAIRITS